MKNYIVYCAVNLINGHRYVGMTSRGLGARAYSHKQNALRGIKSIFADAMREFGVDMFKFSTVAHFKNKTDADMLETHLINSWKTEYNFVKSKLNYVPRPKTSAQIAKAIEDSRRQDSIIRWNVYRAMGPKASSKRVRCLNDGREFESASAAARYYDVPKSAVIELCLKKSFRHTIGGRKFEYVLSS